MLVASGSPGRSAASPGFSVWEWHFLDVGLLGSLWVQTPVRANAPNGEGCRRDAEKAVQDFHGFVDQLFHIMEKGGPISEPMFKCQLPASPNSL